MCVLLCGCLPPSCCGSRAADGRLDIKDVHCVACGVALVERPVRFTTRRRHEKAAAQQDTLQSCRTMNCLVGNDVQWENISTGRSHEVRDRLALVSCQWHIVWVLQTAVQPLIAETMILTVLIRRPRRATLI